ncbi:hypothetical protein Q4S45_14555 [Massilia sp. R2A-15]|uniref:hypothetical protein n=1 Tax=Massilia sp. R2A-15 TaxID=3064278 RepID=UPI002736AF02|nr:hypothetical protein [Massilia sp. R2A-15]WLI87959.1 hypothetical protein Q4S45_14555 [Massilia sp. R2A-15]
MKRSRTLRNRLLSPLVYLGALILLLEEWFWDLGLRLVRLIAGWPPLKALERHIVALPPYAALAAFVLPALLLLPVKIIALIAIASGHPISGIAVIVVAKIGGAALVARIYFLTRPTLLTLAWFERWHTRFIDIRDRWIARLKATDAYRRVSMLSALMRGAARTFFARLRPRVKSGARSASRPARMLRRFIAIWRARRR